MLGRGTTNRDARTRVPRRGHPGTRLVVGVAAIAAGAVAASGLAVATGAQLGLRSLDGVIVGGTFDDRSRAADGRTGEAGTGLVPPVGPGDPVESIPPTDPPPAPRAAPPPAPHPSPAPPAAGRTDPLSPEYNPYTTPGDPAFVPDAAKSAWLGEEAVVRQCMRAAGFEYLEWQWWYGGSPKPDGLDAAAEAAWMAAYSGTADAAVGALPASRAAAEPEPPVALAPGTEAPVPPSEPPVAEAAPEPQPAPPASPAPPAEAPPADAPPADAPPEPTPPSEAPTTPPGEPPAAPPVEQPKEPSGDASPSPAADGCRAVGRRAAAAAEAGGVPLRAEIPPPPGPEVPTERERWLDFQAEVRACMRAAGQEYRYWEYWNPAYRTASGALVPAEPDGLDAAGSDAWQAALYGGHADTGGGCWRTGLLASDYRTFP